MSFPACFGRKDSATFVHVLFSLVCKLWPPKLAPSEPTGHGLVVGILLSPQLNRVLLDSLKQIGCFHGSWTSFNIWVNYEWKNDCGLCPLSPTFLGRHEAYWHFVGHYLICVAYQIATCNRLINMVPAYSACLDWRSDALHLASYASLILFLNNFMVGL